MSGMSYQGHLIFEYENYEERFIVRCDEVAFLFRGFNLEDYWFKIDSAARKTELGTYVTANATVVYPGTTTSNKAIITFTQVHETKNGRYRVKGTWLEHGVEGTLTFSGKLRPFQSRC